MLAAVWPVAAPGQDPPRGNAVVTVELATDSKADVLSNRRVRARIGSDQAVGFRAKASLRAPGRVIASQLITTSLDGGGAERTVSMPLSPRARRALKGVRKGLKFVVDGTAVDAAGAETPVKRTIKLPQR